VNRPAGWEKSMGRAIVIDEKKCTGCRSCELACSGFKEGEYIPERARISVITDALEGWSRPTVCLQCEDPMCLAVCPADALTKTETPDGDRLILLDRDSCIGCRRCMVACPVGAIDFFPKLKAIKCDLCGGAPKCVQFCFYGCLHFVDLSEQEDAERTKKVSRLFNRTSAEIAKRDTHRRRQDASLRASQVTPAPAEEEAGAIDFPFMS
jgi:carbon-monoxide dehydrogenase iron sulfur subunit